MKHTDKYARDSETFSVLDQKYSQLGLTTDMWQRATRKPVPSFYSIDAPKDTIYLTVDHGKPVAQQPRGRSPSPEFSDLDDDSFDLKPPVPLKNLKQKIQFGKRKESKSNIPVGYSAKAPEWEQPQSKFSWDTERTGHSPELPDPDMGVDLREDLQVPGSRFSWTTYATEEPRPSEEPGALPDLSSLTFPPQAYQDIPRSRFSWTTYNTNTHDSMLERSPLPGHTSSPPSPPPTPPSPAEPVLARRRPLPRPDEFGFYPDKHQIKRKPTPLEATSLAPQSAPAGGKIDDKDLPLPPGILEAEDAVTALKAEVSSLEHRRYNLEKVIQGLTALQPSNPVEFDLAKRREAKERIEAFERELADVKRKEHELGVRLHRTIRRRDEQEPTGLWVRRVTG